MSYVLVIIGSIAGCWIYSRISDAFVRQILGKRSKSDVRDQMLGKMSYDELISLRGAVGSELARRSGS